MRRWVVAAMVLASLLIPGTAAGAQQGCRLVSPEEGAVLHKGSSYRFEAVGCSRDVRGHLSQMVLVEVAMSRDAASDEHGDWSVDHVVNDYSLSMETLVWVRFEDGTRSTSVKVRIADR
ncbi:hypothetical protein DL991_20170 [Amycolatopsis sp. WAC 01375]|uniref:hypothetical protein n=1 Tax=unclassified Amycolatopsis TaxID=2618356 RepID=UPI000F772C93|nr:MULTISPECIES: hypothetical protein [unclassified Amycolatopsis]RSM60630.1 hypothetical protein DMH03_17945 [Amycolatopsis sp. WAC 01376]RSM77441.1 hypothetical protein DL991_20170 [Amycolatopsis sp. WAC 01375]RSN30483.1 hypothetical protein DL990_21040 [Amycolatopsis sp. WAC 01416]